MTATTPLMVFCPRCGRHVLEVRWDWKLDTVIGKPRLDPIGLNDQQVVTCVITGIPLWQVHEHAGKTVTSRRGRLWPKEPMPGQIVPEHMCGRMWDGPSVVLHTPETTPATSDVPPF